MFLSFLNHFKNNSLDFSKPIDGFGSTTHVSIIDKENNAASITTTNGEGCGYTIPEYGIMMNNMLGEEDLNPFGFHNWNKKRRLPTMISPIIITKNNKLKFIFGSGGSNRIRSANIQVILNLLIHKMGLKDSISKSRLDQLSKILGKRGKFLKIGLPSNFGSPFRNKFIALFWSAVLTISLKLSSFIPFFCCW